MVGGGWVGGWVGGGREINRLKNNRALFEVKSPIG